jgi:hypothetical protein
LEGEAADAEAVRDALEHPAPLRDPTRLSCRTFWGDALPSARRRGTDIAAAAAMFLRPSLIAAAAASFALPSVAGAQASETTTPDRTSSHALEVGATLGTGSIHE